MSSAQCQKCGTCISGSTVFGGILADLYSILLARLTRGSLDDVLIGFTTKYKIVCPKCKKYEGWAEVKPLPQQKPKPKKIVQTTLLVVVLFLSGSSVQSAPKTAEAITTEFLEMFDFGNANQSVLETESLKLSCNTCQTLMSSGYLLGVMYATSFQDDVADIDLDAYKKTILDGDISLILSCMMRLVQEYQVECSSCKKYIGWGFYDEAIQESMRTQGEIIFKEEIQKGFDAYNK